MYLKYFSLLGQTQKGWGGGELELESLYWVKMCANLIGFKKESIC